MCAYSDQKASLLENKKHALGEKTCVLAQLCHLEFKDLGTSLEDNGLLFIFNWRIIVYNIMLVSAMQQRESAVGTHMLPPS